MGDLKQILNDLGFYLLLLLGCLATSAAVYFYIRTKYSDAESKIIDGISDYAAELYDKLDRMYYRKTMNYCYLLITLSAGLFGALGFLLGLQFSLLLSVIVAVVLGVLGFKLPGIVIRFFFNRRIQKFDDQLVDALNMMSNAIKSGLSFLQVVQILERELSNPAAQEFGMVLKENRVGVNLNDALQNMTKRVPSSDLFMIVNSVVTLSKQGGNLSEAFENIAFTIRERRRVTEKIKTLAQAGLTQATILSSMPFVMFGILYSMQPEYMGLLLTTRLGNALLAGMMILIVAGALWMKKILTIEI